MKAVVSIFLCVLFLAAGCQGKSESPPQGGSKVPVFKGNMPKDGKQPGKKVNWQ